MSEPVPPLTGGCLCGAVRFEATAPLWCAHCHCSLCRRTHGAAFVTWVGVAEAGFRFTAGEERLRRHRSSATAERAFCGECGSPLTFRSPRWEGEVHVTRASLDPTSPQPTPMVHAFWDDRAAWVKVDDHLPRLGGPTGTEPIG